MKTERKENRKYVFTVEGETEKWYLDWLEVQINSYTESKYFVSIKAEVQQSPRKYVKKVNLITTPSITHLCDYEGNDVGDVKKFQGVLTELKDANTIKGKKLYSLGYSNLTFELWIILHKQPCNGELTHRKDYLTHINKIFGDKFENLEQYKQEKNFKKCLSKLTLDDVKSAIGRSEKIMQMRKQNGEVLELYKGFSYYKTNPSLSIGEVIKAIFEDCAILQKNNNNY